MVVVPPHLSPTLLGETLNKVERCMARLEELRHTVRGRTNLSPHNSRGYFETGIRSKQESSLRIINASSRMSPPGKLLAGTADDWQTMSLPAMLLGETMSEVLQATQFARTIVKAATVSSNKTRPKTDIPKTPPPTHKRNPKPNAENSMQARRRREKQIRSEPSDMPSLKRSKSKINFNVPSSPMQQIRECDNRNCRYIANRVSPRNKPWARKTVMFPNPLFHSEMPSPALHHKSHEMSRNNRQALHKFLINSPPKIKTPPKASLSSLAAAKIRSFSPSRLASRLVSPLKSKRSSCAQKNEEIKITEIASYKFLIKSPPGKTKSSLDSTAPAGRSNFVGNASQPKASKLRRSFSPPRLANRIVMSPLNIKSNSMKKYEKIIISELNQRPTFSSTRF